MNKTIRSASRVSSDLAHLARHEWEEAATIVGSSALIDGKPLFATAMTDARVMQQVRDLLGRSGRVHLPEAFGADAVKPIFEACRDAEYQLVFKGSRTNYDFSTKDVAALEVGHKVALIESIHAQATTGFQYLYDSYRLSDFAEAGTLAPGVLADLFAALNTDATLALFRAMTGDDRIGYVDAQLTRYRQAISSQRTTTITPKSIASSHM